jgi:hypothetical protein
LIVILVGAGDGSRTRNRFRGGILGEKRDRQRSHVCEPQSGLVRSVVKKTQAGGTVSRAHATEARSPDAVVAGGPAQGVGAAAERQVDLYERDGAGTWTRIAAEWARGGATWVWSYVYR